jgi:hypothetical protein
MDDRDGDAGREPEGDAVGLGAAGSERTETESPRGVAKYNHPIIERDGVRFYAITRYNGKKGDWIDYQPVDGDWSGNGSIPSDSPVVRAKAQLAREDAAQRKAQRAIAYEDRVYEALESVASLQTHIVNLANDAGAVLDKGEMEKLRLGLAAGESILNRALGKAVTKVDMDVTHSTADQIAEIEAEWVEEIDE